MIVFFLFYVFIIPICMLLHEIGHGLGIVLFSKSPAHIYLGNHSEENKENFKIGRFHFHIHWSYFGFCRWPSRLTKGQKFAAMAGGPLMSLFLVILFFLLLQEVPQGELYRLIQGIVIFNAMNFLVTAIPMTYPRWLGSYAGHPSDGLQLLRLFREK
ncbi:MULTISPECIES: hypothetical protein [Bacillaceae]|uniref:Peptidase M50 domain-containing protein n=1 Tax=Evansella alkalicola TaxID=745819 RepID=A0ABS6JMP4_9BACI|nr:MULTISPECIES: hypothetical protein [Bacillaceae]MBU9719837.1 hypothetical protein [Bacillus alkalicola]